MVGTTNSSNAYPQSIYIVGPSLANANFTSVQSAINAANSAGGGTVMIQPGSYTEDLTLQANVDLVASNPIGFTSNGVAPTNITGTVTANYTGRCICSGITFRSSGAGPTVLSTAGTPVLLMFFCCVRPNGNQTVVISNAGTFVNLYNCQAEIDTSNFCNVSAGILTMENSITSNIGGGPWGQWLVSGTGLLSLQYATVIGTISLSNSARLNAFYSFMDAANVGNSSLILSDTSVAEINQSFLSNSGTGNIVINAGASCDITSSFIDCDTDSVISGNGTLVDSAITFNNKNSISVTTLVPVVQKPFGFSQFTVGPSGGGAYQTIQSAINAAHAAGGGDILIQPGTYTENLTLQPGINFIGAASFGKFQNIVTINGQHSLTVTGSCAFSNIEFLNTGANIFNITNPGGANQLLAFNQCAVFSTNGSCFNCTGFAAGQIVEIFFTNSLGLASNGSVFIGSAQATLLCELSTFLSTSQVCISLTNGSEIRATSCQFQNTATNDILINSNNCRALLFKNTFGVITPMTVPAITNSGSTIFATGNYYNNNSAGGFYITGTGTYNYGSEDIQGTANGIDPAITQAPMLVRPLATTSVVGTASFNPADFTVSSAGQVSLLGGGGFVWTDQGANTTVVSGSGSFSTAAITLTLPAAPAQGDVCEFAVDNAGALVVQANAGQTIRILTATSAVAGTATSTARGDTLSLVYRTADTTWISTASNGTWMLA